MRTLIIGCSGFTLKYSAYIIDSNSQEVKGIEHIMPEDIANYIGARNDIDEVKLQGPTDYCLGIKEQIEKGLVLEYANKNIKIEVM